MEKYDFKNELYNYFLLDTKTEDGIINKFKFSRLLKSWENHRDEFVRLFENNNIPVSFETDLNNIESDKEHINILVVSKLFATIYSRGKEKGIANFFKSSSTGKLDEMIDNFLDESGKESLFDESRSPMEKAYYASKFKSSYKAINSVAHLAKDFDTLNGIPGDTIDKIGEKHFADLYNIFIENYGSRRSTEILDIRDIDGFKKALEDDKNPNHEIARIFIADSLAQLIKQTKIRGDSIQVEQIIENGDLSPQMSAELKLGLYWRLNNAYNIKRFRHNHEDDIYFELEKHAIDLAKVWDSNDFDAYEAIKTHFAPRIAKMQSTDNLSQEEIAALNERINRIAQLSIDELCEKAEELKDEISDISSTCEAYFRIGLVDSLDDFTKHSSKEDVELSNGETIVIDAIKIKDYKDIGNYLASFFNSFDYQRSPIEYSAEEKAKIERMNALDSIIAGEEHYCTQMFNYKRVLDANGNMYGDALYLYGKDQISPEQIIVMSDELLESSGGLYSFNKDMGKTSRLSKSPEEILKRGMKERVSYVSSEIDIQKDVKPCAIGVIYRPQCLSKEQLTQLMNTAEDIGVPLVLYDYYEISQSLQKDRPNKNVEENREI